MCLDALISTPHLRYPEIIYSVQGGLRDLGSGQVCKGIGKNTEINSQKRNFFIYEFRFYANCL